jgi:hypothetical protein
VTYISELSSAASPFPEAYIQEKIEVRRKHSSVYALLDHKLRNFCGTGISRSEQI